MNAAAIRAEHISKRFRIPLDRASTLKYRVTHPRSSARYRDLYALRDVSFVVPHGQFLGIIGHNGSGKSTLLKVLARIYRPEGGSLSIDGFVSPFLELGVGFNPELTARENVFLNGAILGLTRAEMSGRIDDVIAFAELQDFTEQKLKNFSSGMQVRLAFSVAIQADAGILLMDEVLAVGDASFQEKCFDVFSRYKREGRTIVLVTHDLAAVSNYCDRVLLLDHGQLVADGPAADVAAEYRRMVGARSEKEYQEHHEEQPAGEARSRWGSREVEITEVRLVDAAGQAHHTFASGQAMTVEIDYVAHQQVDDFVCGVLFERSDGLVLAGSNTRIDRITLTCPPAGGGGTIRYTIDRVRFLSAEYLLTVALHDRYDNRSYDHWERVMSFRVMDESGRVGLVETGGRWSTSSTGALGEQAPARVAEGR